MPRRISDTSMFLQAVRNVQMNRSAVASLQLQVSSGKRINSLGDDPGDAAQVLGLRRSTARLDQFQRNIDAAKGLLEPAESTLKSVTDVLTRLRELAVSADVETSQFDKIRPEVEALFDEVMRLANTKVGSRYIFGGFDTATAPFTKTGSFTPGVSAPPPSIAYGGDSGAMQIDIGESAQVQGNIPGNALFLGDTDGDGSFPDTGRVNIFGVISNLRNALDQASPNGVFAEIGNLDIALDQVVETRGAIGARLNRLEITESQLLSLKGTLEARRSDLEDSDSIETITELANQQNTLEASLAVIGRTIQPSILDFLR